MRYSDLMEVRVIDPSPLKTETKPLLDTDTIKVFHGTNNLNMVISMVRHGFTGDERIFRTYSYENNNNPKGIFVTPSMKTAIYFGHIVIEFHTKVSDLEAPVWPSGSFTVQGGKEEFFNDDADRERARQELRSKLRQDDDEVVAHSDRPELAYTLMAMGEPQALFVGSVNPKAIQAVWVSENPDSIDGKMVRMKVSEFLSKLKKEGIKTRFNRTLKDIDPNAGEYIDDHDTSEKVFKPRDTNITWDELFARLMALDMRTYKRFEDDQKFLFDIYYKDDEYTKRHIWSDKQFSILRRDMEKVKKERGW